MSWVDILLIVLVVILGGVGIYLVVQYKFNPTDPKQNEQPGSPSAANGGNPSANGGNPPRVGAPPAAAGTGAVGAGSPPRAQRITGNNPPAGPAAQAAAAGGGVGGEKPVAKHEEVPESIPVKAAKVGAVLALLTGFVHLLANTTVTVSG